MYTSHTLYLSLKALCMAVQPDQRSALNPIDKGVMGAGWWDVECPEQLPPWAEVRRRHPEFMEQPLSLGWEGSYLVIWCGIE